MLAKVLFGLRVERFAAVPDEQGADLVPLLLLGVFLVGFGLFPELLMGVIRSGVTPLEPLLAQLSGAPALLGGGF